jgi:hypothetical protein
MKKYCKVVSISLFLVLLLSACRYENGPFISLYSPEKRLINTWTVQKVFRNEVATSNPEYLANQLGTYYGFHAYGTLVVNCYYEGTFRESYTGSWKFFDNYKKIEIQFLLLDVSYKYTAKIKKLSRSELEYEYTDDNGVKWRLIMYAQPR